MAEKKSVKLVSVPVKLLASVLIEVPGDIESEEDQKKFATDVVIKMAEKFATSDDVRKEELNFSKSISEKLENIFLVVPGVLSPVAQEEDGKIVDEFVNNYLKAIEEQSNVTNVDN